MRIVNQTTGRLKWSAQAEGEPVSASSGVIEPGGPPHAMKVGAPTQVTITTDGIIFDKVTDLHTITVTSSLSSSDS